MTSNRPFSCYALTWFITIFPKARSKGINLDINLDDGHCFFALQFSQLQLPCISSQDCYNTMLYFSLVM